MSTNQKKEERKRYPSDFLRSDKEKGFKVLPRRWVVERTFAWILSARRLEAVLKPKGAGIKVVHSI